MKKVVMFSASWCSPCKQAKPIFEQISKNEPDAYFEVVDIDDNRLMAQDYNITSVPTFLVIEDNEEVNRLVGAQNVVRVKELLRG
jgi:thioredoxin 1